MAVRQKIEYINALNIRFSVVIVEAIVVCDAGSLAVIFSSLSVLHPFAILSDGNRIFTTQKLMR